MPTTILIIEDELQLRELVARYLERDGLTVVMASDGQEGLDAAAEYHPDLVLLDVNLPDLDGWSILRRFRGESNFQPPVIMLTARGDESDRLLGLDLGADDYIVKPFSPREVLARVKAVLRRTMPASAIQEVINFPGLCIDLPARTVCRNELSVETTPKEFDLLVALASRPNRVLTRQVLYETVWGDDGQGDDHTLDVHINRLRHKLQGADGLRYLTTVKGVGFKFEVLQKSET